MFMISDQAEDSRKGKDETGNSEPVPVKRYAKDRSQFIRVLRKCVEEAGIDVDSTVLVIGGRQDDVECLRRCGFHRITVSTLDGVPDEPEAPGDLPVVAADAEDIRLPDGSYDVVFVHEVIHHCRSPHRAMCEMLRVARSHVVMMEPNESAFTRLLTWMQLSFPFELWAVIDHKYVSGGVRDSQIPNFIFRWNKNELEKLTWTFLAEYNPRVYVDRYWDFNFPEADLALRKQTRVGMITGLIGAKNFLRLLHAGQSVLNRVPIFRRQGNKFFCCVHKTSELRPWLALENDGRIIFNRSFQFKKK
jgi:SAM-dependent methyltransferase